MEKMPDAFAVTDLLAKCEKKTPYILVCFQECERMNNLTTEIKRSLRELDLGLKGELTMTRDMEELSSSLYFDQVPLTWTNLAYTSLYGLTAWYADLLLRISELQGWTSGLHAALLRLTLGLLQPAVLPHRHHADHGQEDGAPPGQDV